jgi:hypothetical protein
MKATKPDHSGRIWFFAVAGAVVIGLAVLGLFRAPAPAPARSNPPAPLAIVEIAPRDAAMHEPADFSDPTPLFLPTQWNAKPNILPGTTIREPGDDFRYEGQFTFAVSAAKLSFPAKVNVPEKPVDALGLWGAEGPFLGMGQADLKIEPLAGRDALVEVVTASDGRQVFTQVLKAASPPGGDWQPMEFLVAVEPAGLVGLPAPAPSSNAVEVAAYFQNYLAKVLRVGERLAPGIYRIKVGP